LRRDISGSAAHISTPPKKASERYADMTFDACENFVGPTRIPVNVFFQEFVPAAPITGAQGSFSFSEDSVSQNDDKFVTPPIFLDVQS
jgi:hypothetical protein